MKFGDRLTWIVLGWRRSVGAHNADGSGRIDDPRGRALDAMLKRFAPLAGRLGANLNLLAALCGTDKYGAHDYTPVYQELMSPRRRQPVRLLEIGVGGFESGLGGDSLLMWAAYFSKGRVYGIDFHDKTALSRGRIEVLQCSQTDDSGLTRIGERCGPFDFIIDDGSHVSSHQVASFRVLWPFVKDRGIYIIEDTQTSYWPAFGGGPLGSSDYAHSCVSYFKGMTDSVNAPELLEPAGAAPRLDPTIGSIAFHHNLIVITKNAAVRRSNLPLENEALRRKLMDPRALQMSGPR
jgi:demethylmacrocin O-methyltransferase